MRVGFLWECLRFALCLAGTLYFLVLIIQAARTGKIRNKASVVFLDDSSPAVMFFSGCLIFLLFAWVFGYYTLRAFHDAWSAWQQF